MSRYLVTGSNGFVGKYLVRALYDAGHEVVGLDIADESVAENEKMLKQYWSCDLSKGGFAVKLELSNIDIVINLAALTSVPESFEIPEKYKTNNVDSLRYLGEALIRGKSKARVVTVSSSSIYEASSPVPFKETSAINPKSSPYAESKVLMEKAAKRLRGNGLDIIVVRPFNHSGPNQRIGFLIPDLIERIKNTNANGKIEVGNLKTKRDYTDVRDIVRAYIMLGEAPRLNHSLYNVSSGRPVSGDEILKMISETLGKNIQPVTNTSNLRPNDHPIQYGDYSRLKGELGWEPEISLSKTISDTIQSHGR